MLRMRLLSVLAGVLALTACAVPRDATEREQTTMSADAIIVTDDLPTGSFGTASGAFFGHLFVRGYAVLEKRTEPLCTHDCATIDYVFLRVLATGAPAVIDYIQQLDGNAYAAEHSIGLGCKTEEHALSFSHVSDAHGMRTHTVSPAAFAHILDATPEEPVTLYLEKLPFSGGSEAPVCFSHFNVIRVRQSGD